MQLLVWLHTIAISVTAKSQIAVRIPPSLLEALNRYVEETGITKTEVIVSAIAAYLDCGSEIAWKIVSINLNVVRLI